MVWREQSNHNDNCYFCCTDISDYNSKNKKIIVYPNLSSAIRPIPHGPGIPIPQPPESLQDIVVPTYMSSDDDPHESSERDPTFDCDRKLNREVFTQSELSDLVRDLSLTKEKAELLASRLKEKNLLAEYTSVRFYRKRELQFTHYFEQEGDLVFCSDIPGLMREFGIEYEKEAWRLFIDSCKRSLKAVLLHNGYSYVSVSIGHSVHLKETYENIQLILTKVKYSDHQWMICGDLKVICMVLGQRQDLLSSHAFCANGTAEPESNTGSETSGQFAKLSFLELKTFCD